jgi:hypothetical protein
MRFHAQRKRRRLDRDAPTSFAPEEIAAQLPLKPPHGCTQRRLGYAATLGCKSKIA